MTVLVVRGPEYTVVVHHQATRVTSAPHPVVHRWAAGEPANSVRRPFRDEERLRHDVLGGRSNLEWWTQWSDGWTMDMVTEPGDELLRMQDLYPALEVVKTVVPLPPNSLPILNGPPTGGHI